MTLFGAYVGSDPQPAWSGGLVDLLAEFGCSTGSARVALNRVVERGLLERHRDGRFISYAPTARLLELMAVGDRRMDALTEATPWAGEWTFIWYSLPEEMRRERHRMSRRLRFLGFGTLEDSTWIAPHDQRDEVVPYLERLDVRERVGLFVGRHEIAPDAIVARAWDSDDLTARYREFLDEFAEYDGRDLPDDEAFIVRTRLVDAFRRFPYLDPGLPEELFPAAAAREQAAALFRSVYPALAEQAQSHFDETTRRTEAADPATAGA